MSIRWLTALLDSPRSDTPATLDFWRQITKSTLSEMRGAAGEFATLLPEAGDPFLRIQEIGGHAGCHLDVHVDDLRGHLAQAVESGATVGREVVGGWVAPQQRSPDRSWPTRAVMNAHLSNKNISDFDYHRWERYLPWVMLAGLFGTVTLGVSPDVGSSPESEFREVRGVFREVRGVFRAMVDGRADSLTM